MATHTPSGVARLIEELRAGLASALRTCADFLAPKPKTPDLSALLDGAPLDDEPLTEQERGALERADADIRRGDVHSLEEIKRELA